MFRQYQGEGWYHHENCGTRFKLNWSFRSNHYPKEEAVTLQKKATILLISGITALIGVLVTLAKGTTYNTITLKKVAATVATKTDLNFKILGEKTILTCEAAQTFKFHTKICFLTGQYGPR